ncbi:uncharacterized protein LOC114867461 isoform X2 [Betta splendens]|uniref:Uncharacterized protein LOC114867461 isoform X2 n=1 Tax=Betta splendens TaxID=158456 RepID=A0A9W2XMX0_BETSP|nr:uncharacterized protein LOC114867461 isoform X2 [Betta splendens]XP_055363002.1 uncharacterized protein LOC114867461 isoform X2 [Betta splendens]
MVWILLFVLISSDCGTFGAVLTSNLYQTEEQSNITFRWDSQKKTDLSQANLICGFESNSLKIIHELKTGVELSDSQHQQFSGRVHLDKDALRQGQIRLHVSTVTANDSGKYRCDLAANYDENQKKWEIMAIVRFVLDVSPKTRKQEISGSPASSVTAGTKQDKPQQRDVWIKLIVVTGASILVYLIYMCSEKMDPKILELLHFGQELSSNLDRAAHLFPVENHGLRFGGTDSHPSRFTLSCNRPQCTLEVLAG